MVQWTQCNVPICANTITLGVSVVCTAGISFWIFYCFTHSQLQKASSEEVVTEESYGTFHWWAGCSWEEGMSVVVSAEDCRTVYVWELLWHVGFFYWAQELVIVDYYQPISYFTQHNEMLLVTPFF